MSITVRVPGPLRNITSGQSEVNIEAADLGQLLERLDGQYAGFRARICDANGAVSRFVNVYVNDEDIRFLNGLQTTLQAGDRVSIIPAIAGG